MSSNYMECIKTGALITLAHNEWVFGDLFRFGSGHIMKVASKGIYGRDTPPRNKVHAEFDTWHDRWNENDGDKEVIFPDGIFWFDYDGKELPIKSS